MQFFLVSLLVERWDCYEHTSGAAVPVAGPVQQHTVHLQHRSNKAVQQHTVHLQHRSNKAVTLPHDSAAVRVCHGADSTVYP